MYIEVEFSDAGLWGQTDPDADGYNAQASSTRFARMLTRELENEFPDAEVDVKQGINDYHRVNEREDTDDAVWVGEAVNRIWSPFNWIVDA